MKSIFLSLKKTQINSHQLLKGGVLAILSGALLVLFFAKLDEIVSRRYFQVYQVNLSFYVSVILISISLQQEISRTTLTLMAGCIVLSILVNILLILG